YSVRSTRTGLSQRDKLHQKEIEMRPQKLRGFCELCVRPSFSRGCRFGRLLEEMAMSPKLGITLFEPLGNRDVEQGLQVCDEMLFERCGGRSRILMGAAKRLRNNSIGQAQFDEVLGGDLQGLGRH